MCTMRRVTYYDDESLEYLFGSRSRDESGAWVYWPLWAHDRAEERRAFEAWMDWISERLRRHPDLHVFHYNHYEATALKKLMSRYRTREHELDELLRRQVLVDLYAVLTQAMRIGTESYGLKAVEAVYSFQRAGGRRKWCGPRLRAVARHPPTGASGRDRRVQRRRLPLDARALRLAVGPPSRGRGAIRPRDRCPRAEAGARAHREAEGATRAPRSLPFCADPRATGG